MKIIVGLGNADPKYVLTKHNIGADFIDLWSETIEGTTVSVKLLEADLEFPIHSSRVGEVEVVAFKPQTNYNNSGIPIKAFCDAFEIPSSDLVVVADDMNLKVGEFKIDLNWVQSRNNGIKSIIGAVGNNFTWVRIGIGKPKGNNQWLGHVLSPFQDRKQIEAVLKEAVIATKELVRTE